MKTQLNILKRSSANQFPPGAEAAAGPVELLPLARLAVVLLPPEQETAEEGDLGRRRRRSRRQMRRKSRGCAIGRRSKEKGLL